jgi:hypothetical protein
MRALRVADAAAATASPSPARIHGHPATFFTRPALAPMYTALGLSTLDQVISHRKLHWDGHV